MLSSDEVEDVVFFDSVDCLSPEESIVAKEKSGYEKSEYEIWINEPQSVNERRQSFLHGMGLVQFSAKNEIAHGNSSEMMGLNRITECSGAVSRSLDSPVSGAEENLVLCEREMTYEANSMVDELEKTHLNDQSMAIQGENTGFSSQSEQREALANLEECKSDNVNMKKLKSWWKRFVSARKGREGTYLSEVSKSNTKSPKMSRMKVKQNKKRCMEFTAVYMGQEIQAHKGFIWTMRFSPDGQYLASGGEDGVVRIWRVTSMDAACCSFIDEGNFGSNVKEGKSSSHRKKSIHAPIVIPEKVFQIEESPLQEFHGHASDVLDLAWSNSNCLLSCSKDNTVRLWQVGSDECLNVFCHKNYVTCIQFNPVDENYFISGSIDGKVRIWGVHEKRVVDWADVRDVISAICYHPNGKGFIVGTIMGTCRFYEASGRELILEAETHIQDRKKSSGNKITGIQFSLENSGRVMISSKDSKLRILDGVEVAHKFRGLPRSGSQMSASFTPTGNHIISVGGDCRVYVWNYNGLCIPSSKRTKSVSSCEHFLSEGVSVAVPWSGMRTECWNFGGGSLRCHSQTQGHQKCASSVRESEHFSFSSWFSKDGSCRGSATWPEEKLPLWDVTIAEDNCNTQHHHNHQQQHNNNNIVHDHLALLETWGFVIVTAGWDGTIRTFHNYGLPVRL